MLVLFCISLIVGASLFYVLHLSIGVICFASILYGGIFCFIFRTKRAVLLGLALAGTMVLGAFRFWLLAAPELSLGNQAFTGVVESVDERLDKTLLVIRKDEGRVAIQVTLREKQPLLPGDSVSVRGRVELPEDFVTDTGRLFDYDHYLSSKGVDAIVSFGQVVKLKEGHLSFIRIATKLRFWIAELLAKHIRFPIDGVVGGMLVGFQGGIPKYLSDIFRNTGTLHTLVLSGYNITVLAGFLGLLFRRFPFRTKTVLVGFGIVVLVFISGAGVAAVRAGIMGSIALFAGMTLSSYSALRALLVSFLFFFFTSPLTVFVDPGFHLSFLATAFIILFLPKLNELLTFIPVYKKVNLRELLILAITLPLFMLPYTMYFSGLFPIVSPLANIFLMPIIPLLMLGGLGVIVFSFIPFLSSAIGFVTGFVGTLSISILTFLSSLPLWHTPALSGWGVVFAYGILFSIVFRKSVMTYFVQLRKVFLPQTNSHF